MDLWTEKERRAPKPFQQTSSNVKQAKSSSFSAKSHVCNIYYPQDDKQQAGVRERKA